MLLGPWARQLHTHPLKSADLHSLLKFIQRTDIHCVIRVVRVLLSSLSSCCSGQVGNRWDATCEGLPGLSPQALLGDEEDATLLASIALQVGASPCYVSLPVVRVAQSDLRPTYGPLHYDVLLQSCLCSCKPYVQRYQQQWLLTRCWG